MKLRGKKGIVLLEILIALAVMGIGIVALMQALAYVNRQDQVVRHHAGAVLIAQNILSRRLAGELEETTGEEILEQQKFLWRLTAESDSAGLVAGSLIVSWQEAGRERAFSVATVFAPSLL